MNTLWKPFWTRVPSLKRLRPVPSWTTAYGNPRPGWLDGRRSAFWKTAGGPFVALWYDGIRLWINPGEEISSCVFLQGFYEPNQMSFLCDQLRSGSVFVDVGAHFGLYSLLASNRVGAGGRVIAIEPSPREFERLQKNLKINRADNVLALNVAASDAESTADLQVAREPHTGHNTLGRFAYAETGLKGPDRTVVRTLDRILADAGVAHVDVIKLDIEGSEMNALRGAAGIIARSRPILMIEIMDVSLRSLGSSGGELWEHLRSMGYRMLGYDPVSGRPAPVGAYPPEAYPDFIALPEEGARHASL